MAFIREYLTTKSHHPQHKKKIDTNPLKGAIHLRLKEAGKYLHNKVNIFSKKKQRIIIVKDTYSGAEKFNI